MAEKQLKRRRMLQNEKPYGLPHNCRVMNRLVMCLSIAPKRPSFVVTALSLWLIIFTPFGCGHKAPSIKPTPIPSNAEDASLVFLGTVAKPVDGGVTESRAVRVDRIYFQRGTFDDQTGSEVIVSGEGLPTSGQYVFHVEPYQFGARIQAELKVAEPRKPYTEEEVGRLRHAKRKLELLPRVKDARFIFVGSVVSTRPWQGRERTESEHDPQWILATATVKDSLLGQVDGTQPAFLYAGSDDVQWYRSPKPTKGDEAMFLLRRGAPEISPSLSETWTLIHEDDLLRGDDMNIVREIISQGGAK